MLESVIENDDVGAASDRLADPTHALSADDDLDLFILVDIDDVFRLGIVAALLRSRRQRRGATLLDVLVVFFAALREDRAYGLPQEAPAGAEACDR